MRLPDILGDDSGSFKLLKVTHKRETKEDEETGGALFTVTIDLEIELGDDEKVDSAPDYWPGALAALKLARAGADRRQATSELVLHPGAKWRKIVMHLQRGEGHICLSGVPCEVVKARFKPMAKGSRYVAKVRIPGLLSSEHALILECVERPVEATWAPVQAVAEVKMAAK